MEKLKFHPKMGLSGDGFFPPGIGSGAGTTELGPMPETRERRSAEREWSWHKGDTCGSLGSRKAVSPSLDPTSGLALLSHLEKSVLST